MITRGPTPVALPGYNHHENLPGPPKDRFLFSAFDPTTKGTKAEKRNRSFGGPGTFPTLPWL